MNEVQVVVARGPNVRAICAEVRRRLRRTLADLPEVLRSGGEDGHYRVHLGEGDSATIVEVTITQRKAVEIVDSWPPLAP